MWNDCAPGDKLLTKGEVAQLCRVEIRTVDRWVAAGKIRCYRIPSGRLLFRKQDVLMAAERQQERVVQVTDDPARSRNGFRVTTPVPRSPASAPDIGRHR